MTRVGMMYHNALGGVPRDPAEAAAWWSKAAVAGDADGQAMLGAAHLMGAGAVRDPERALWLLLQAKAGGSELALRFIDAARGALTEARAKEIENAVLGRDPELAS